MKVSIIMGSKSDWEVMSAACETLEQFGVPFEKKVGNLFLLRERVISKAQAAAVLTADQFTDNRHIFLFH